MSFRIICVIVGLAVGFLFAAGCQSSQVKGETVHFGYTGSQPAQCTSCL